MTSRGLHFSQHAQGNYHTVQFSFFILYLVFGLPEIISKCLKAAKTGQVSLATSDSSEGQEVGVASTVILPYQDEPLAEEVESGEDGRADEDEIPQRTIEMRSAGIQGIDEW